MIGNNTMATIMRQYTCTKCKTKYFQAKQAIRCPFCKSDNESAMDKLRDTIIPIIKPGILQVGDFITFHAIDMKTFLKKNHGANMSWIHTTKDDKGRHVYNLLYCITCNTRSPINDTLYFDIVTKASTRYVHSNVSENTVMSMLINPSDILQKDAQRLLWGL